MRRAFLWGKDDVTGRDFSHSKVWLQGRLESLASVFAIGICTVSVMSNHFHALLRIRPDLATAWTDEEVAYRWACVRAIYRKHKRTMPEPNRAHIDELLNAPKELADHRKRLVPRQSAIGPLNTDQSATIGNRTYTKPDQP